MAGIPDIGREVPGLIEDSNARPADALLPPPNLIIPDATSSKYNCLDFAVTHTLQHLHLTTADVNAGAAAKRYEDNVKYPRYSADCSKNNLDFTPMVVETYGAWGPASKKVFNFVGKAAAIAQREDPDKVIGHMGACLSFILQRQNVATLLKHLTPSCPGLTDPVMLSGIPSEESTFPPSHLISSDDEPLTLSPTPPFASSLPSSSTTPLDQPLPITNSTTLNKKQKQKLSSLLPRLSFPATPSAPRSPVPASSPTYEPAETIPAVTATVNTPSKTNLDNSAITSNLDAVAYSPTQALKSLALERHFSPHGSPFKHLAAHTPKEPQAGNVTSCHKRTDATACTAPSTHVTLIPPSPSTPAAHADPLVSPSRAHNPPVVSLLTSPPG